MSTRAAQEFINRANQDAVIRKLALERFTDIVSVGRELGYDFELDEFDEAMRERKAMQAQGPKGGPSGSRDDSGATCQCTPTGRRDDSSGTCQCTPTGRRQDRDDSGGTCQCTPTGRRQDRDDSGGTCQCTPTGRRPDRDEYGGTCQCTPAGGQRR
jgi:hypothetical protein